MRVVLDVIVVVVVVAYNAYVTLTNADYVTRCDNVTVMRIYACFYVTD